MVKTAVILAAGMGLRLTNYTKEKPKAFIEIEGRTLIERSISALIENGIDKIIIGTGFCSEYFDCLQKSFDNVTIKCLKNEEYRDSGSMLTLFRLRKYIAAPFLLLESDLLYENRAIEAIQGEPRDNVILVSDFTKAGDEVFIESNSLGYLTKLSKDIKELTSVSAELVGISKVSLDAFKAFCLYFEKHVEDLKNAHYETGFSCLAPQHYFFVLKLNDLLWCEIDNKMHLVRAREVVYPKIKRKNRKNL